MRHFLGLTLTVGALPGGVVESTRTGLLVATTGTAHRCPAGEQRAAIEAVQLATITPRAELHLLVAPLAVVKTIAPLHPSPPPEDTGQWGRSGASFYTSVVSLISPTTTKEGPGRTKSLGLQPSWR